MLPNQLRSSLHVAQIVGFLTLMRSIAYDRWITVLGSVLLMIGASAALRHKTWGVGLALAASSAFPVAWAIGIAPAWFCLVGLFGAMPFALSWSAMKRFDVGAARLYAILAAAGGTATAILWKESALSVFRSIPALAPSGEVNHGILLATMTAGAALATLFGFRFRGCSHIPNSRVASLPDRVDTSVRVETAEEDELAADEADEALRSSHR